MNRKDRIRFSTGTRISDGILGTPWDKYLDPITYRSGNFSVREIFERLAADTASLTIFRKIPCVKFFPDALRNTGRFFPKFPLSFGTFPVSPKP
jgi:hypothetical protein